MGVEWSSAPSDAGLPPCTPATLKPAFKPIHKQGTLTSLRIAALISHPTNADKPPAMQQQYLWPNSNIGRASREHHSISAWGQTTREKGGEHRVRTPVMDATCCEHKRDRLCSKCRFYPNSMLTCCICNPLINIMVCESPHLICIVLY